tara:strand:+ start:37593 stop:37787 length:195 start_codon:yes stop_codon:yes gene_type:complete
MSNKVVSCIGCGCDTTAKSELCNDCMYQDEVAVHNRKDELDLVYDDMAEEEERELGEYWHLAEN